MGVLQNLIGSLNDSGYAQLSIQALRQADQNVMMQEKIFNDIASQIHPEQTAQLALQASNSATNTAYKESNLQLEQQRVNILKTQSIANIINMKASLDMKMQKLLADEELNKMKEALVYQQTVGQILKNQGYKIQNAFNANKVNTQVGNANNLVSIQLDQNGNAYYTKPNPNSSLVLEINANNKKALLDAKIMNDAIKQWNNGDKVGVATDLSILKGNPNQTYNGQLNDIKLNLAKTHLFVMQNGKDKAIEEYTKQFIEQGYKEDEAKQKAINWVNSSLVYSPLASLQTKQKTIFDRSVANQIKQSIVDAYTNGNKKQALQVALNIFSKYNYDYDAISKSPYKELLSFFKNIEETLTIYKFTNIIKSSNLEPKVKQTLLTLNNSIISGDINNKKQLIKGLNILEQVGSKTLNPKDYGRLINVYITKLQQYKENGKIDNNTFNVLRKSLNELKAIKFANNAIKTNNIKEFKKYLKEINSENGINMILDSTKNIKQFIDVTENIYKSNVEPITGKKLDYVGEKNKELLKATYNKVSSKLADVVDWLSKTFGIQKTTLDGETLREKLKSTDNKLLGSLYIKSVVEQLSSNTTISKIAKQYGITYKDVLQYIPKETDNFEDMFWRKDNDFAESLNHIKDNLNLEPKTLLTLATNYALFKKQNQYKDFSIYLKNINNDLYNKIIIDYANNFNSGFLGSRDKMIKENKSKWIKDIDNNLNSINSNIDDVKDYLLRIISSSATLMTLQKLQSLNY